MAAEPTSGLERKKNTDITANSLSKERMSSITKVDFMERIRRKECCLLRKPCAPDIWLKNVYGLIFHRKRKRLRVKEPTVEIPQLTSH